MGTDIHCVVEKYNKATKKWEAIEGLWGRSHGYDREIYEGRNYELFDLLAGARGNYKFYDGFKPKGFPKKISAAGKLYANSDYHSHTYFYLSELLRTDLFFKHPDCVWFYVNVVGGMLALDAHPERDEIRILICFDS